MSDKDEIQLLKQEVKALQEMANELGQRVAVLEKSESMKHHGGTRKEMTTKEVQLIKGMLELGYMGIAITKYTGRSSTTISDIKNKVRFTEIEPASLAEIHEYVKEFNETHVQAK